MVAWTEEFDGMWIKWHSMTTSDPIPTPIYNWYVDLLGHIYICHPMDGISSSFLWNAAVEPAMQVTLPWLLRCHRFIVKRHVQSYSIIMQGLFSSFAPILCQYHRLSLERNRRVESPAADGVPWPYLQMPSCRCHHHHPYRLLFPIPPLLYILVVIWVIKETLYPLSAFFPTMRSRPFAINRWIPWPWRDMHFEILRRGGWVTIIEDILHFSLDI